MCYKIINGLFAIDCSDFFSAIDCDRTYFACFAYWTPGISIKSSESHTGEVSDRSTTSELKTTDVKDSSTSGQDIDSESNQSGTMSF